MPQNKKNVFDKKEPLNLSIRKGVKLSFIKYCEKYNVDKSALIESLMLGILHESEYAKESNIKF